MRVGAVSTALQRAQFRTCTKWLCSEQDTAFFCEANHRFRVSAQNLLQAQCSWQGERRAPAEHAGSAALKGAANPRHPGSACASPAPNDSDFSARSSLSLSEHGHVRRGGGGNPAGNSATGLAGSAALMPPPPPEPRLPGAGIRDAGRSGSGGGGACDNQGPARQWSGGRQGPHGGNPVAGGGLAATARGATPGSAPGANPGSGSAARPAGAPLARKPRLPGACAVREAGRPSASERYRAGGAGAKPHAAAGAGGRPALGDPACPNPAYPSPARQGAPGQAARGALGASAGSAKGMARAAAAAGKAQGSQGGVGSLRKSAQAPPQGQKPQHKPCAGAAAKPREPACSAVLMPTDCFEAFGPPPGPGTRGSL